MTIRRNLLISFFFICLALSNSQVYASEKLESVTLQLTWKNQFQFAGYYVAKELGFYNDVGLDVTIKEYESGTDVTQDVLSQKAHFGVGRSALVLESMEGKEVYLLSAIFQHSPLMLLAKKRDDLKQVSDLKGKRIMMTDDVVGKASLTAMLLANGIKSDSYTLQEHTFNTDDLISGKTDAVAAYISNEPHQMEKRGIDYTIFAPKDHGFDFYSDILFTSQKLYNDNPKLVKRFYQASLQGWAYAFSHIDEAVDLILKKYNTQNRRKDALLFEANTLKTLAYNKGVPLGNINKSRIAQIAQVYRLIGLTHQPLKTDNLILEDTPSVALTPEEKAWLDKHPVVRARIGKAPPLHFFDGKPRGISVDYLNLIAKRAGFTVQYVTDIPWSKALEDIKNHETIDLLLTAKVTPERRKYMAFTKDYLLMPWVIFTQKDSSIGSMEDLMHKTVSVERDYVMHKKLAAEYPDINLLVKGTTQEAIEAVATGQADAYIGDLMTGVYIIRQNNLINVKVAASTPFGHHDQAMAIRDDWPELAGIINKGLAAISEKERNEILTRYLGLLWPEGSKTAQTQVALTPEERAWLQAHKTIRIGVDRNYPPFEFIDNKGVYRGITPDYLKLIEKRLGVTFKVVPGLMTWPQVLAGTKDGTVDVIAILSATKDRQEFLNFTQPYINFPQVIVTRKDYPPIESIQDFIGKTVAVTKGYSEVEEISRLYPKIKLHLVDNPLEELEAVATGKADAAQGNLAVFTYFIEKNNLLNLHFAAPSEISGGGMSMGVRKDWPELARILDKTLATISEQERRRIQRNWVSIEALKTPLADETISSWRLIVYAVILFIVLSLFAWILIKSIKEEDIAASFGSPRFRLFVLAGLSIIIIIVCFLGWFTLERNKEKILARVGESLQMVLNTANDRLNLWVAQKTSLMKLFGRDPELLAITRRLLAVPPNRDDLLASEALRDARTFFKNNEEIFANIGFFIINPDHISIGSMRDANIGTQNLISSQRPDLLKLAFEGEVLFVPPIQSDVPLGNSEKTDGGGKQDTKFFIGPIRDLKGRIIAVMTLRIDHSKGFSQALQGYGMLKSGEAYAFNREGQLLSESRFNDQLRQIGLIEKGQQSALNIEIRDPGVNMVEGHHPILERSRQPLTHMASRAIQLKSDMEKAGQHQGYSKIEVDTKAYRDYRGVPVFGAWLWSADLGLGLATEIDADKALSAYYMMRMTVFGVLGFTLFLSVGAILFVLILGERASQALMKARDNLEEKVEKRTAELAEAEERSRLLLESVGDGIFGTDTKGKVIFINSSACRMLGYSSEELLGMNVHETIHHSYADGGFYPKDDCPMEKAYIEESSFSVDDEVLWRKDGINFPVEYSATPIGHGETIVGAVVVFRDITERRQAEEDLNKERLGQKEIVANSPLGVAISTDAVARFANPRFKEMFGLSVGNKLTVIHVNIDDRSHILEELEKNGIIYNFEFQAYDAKGEIIEVLSTYQKIDYEGKPGLLAWLMDITERKGMEEALQKRVTELAEARGAMLNMMEDIEESRKKAEEATQAKSDFLASMSHELRTPLNAIIGFSEVLRDQYFGELNEKQVEYTNDILESGKHLLSLINDILDLSKVEAGKMELDLSQVNISSLLENSMIMIKEKALKHGIALDLKIPEELSGLEIQADERKVKQVMFNLLSNAAKFTPDGGEIRVTVDLISELGIRILELKEDEKQLAIQNPKSKIEVCVADNGIGLSPENQGNIFQEFYQVNGGTTDKSPGTGLGLPLTKSFVEMHGGRIWVESKGEGKGSRFSFLLPVKSEDLEIDAGLLNNLRSLASSYEKHKRPFTLCYLQIDREHFKEEAPRIREAFVKEKRGDDFLVMDKGGDVYLVIQGTDREKIKVACNRLIKKMKSMFEGLEISYLTATFPEDGDTPEAIIKKVRKT